MPDPPTRVRPVPQRQAVDEQLVAPAARGLRKAGLGAGALVFAAVGALGVALTLIGAITMGLAAHAFIDGVGAFLVALGLTASVSGGGGVALLHRVNRKADAAEVRRRLHRLLESEGETTDAEASRRLRVPIETIRAVTDEWIASGALAVEVDGDTGTERYLAGRRGDGEQPELNASQHADFRAFDAELEALDREASEARRSELREAASLPLGEEHGARHRRRL
jgi:hypothetical protein